MRTAIVLVVYDPHDAYSRPDVLPEALASIEALNADVRLVVAINAAVRCPVTVALVEEWCQSRVWASMRLHEENLPIAAVFNHAVHDVLTTPGGDDVDAFAFMSGDALLVDPGVLDTVAAVFERWPKVGAVHPLSTFEDADFANVAPEWSLQAFWAAMAALDGAGADTEGRDDGRGDPFAGAARAVVDPVAAGSLAVSRPKLVLPLTFWVVRRSVLEQVGPLDERWAYGYENMDFALRAYRAGSTSVVVLNAFVYHRRLLFRRLGSYDRRSLQTATGDDGGAHWVEKWGRTPRRAWDEARYGPVVAGTIATAMRVMPRR